MATTMQISQLASGKALIERHYDSQLALARYVMGSWKGSDLESHHALWRQYTADDLPEDILSADNALQLACNRLHGILDPQCQAMVDSVTAIAKRLAGKVRILPTLDIHRKRTTGRAGYALNIHKVNRGQLSTAWKRTVRESRPGETGIVTLVLCTDYSSNASSSHAQYTIGATLALAHKIEETGRRCEIWASILTHDAHHMRAEHDAGKGFTYKQAEIVPGCPQTFDELDHLVVKRANEDLQAPTLAALCSLELVRNLFFQVWRMQRTTIGPMWNYGQPTNKQEVRAKLLPYTTRQGIPESSVFMGADYTDDLYSESAAVSWVQKHLDTLVPGSATVA